MALSVPDSGTQPSRLGLWITDRMRNKGLSTRDVERLSGGAVSKAAVSALTTGRARGLRISPTVAAGLARALGTDPDTIIAMAAAQPGEPYIAPDEARHLTARQRRAVDAVIYALLDE